MKQNTPKMALVDYALSPTKQLLSFLVVITFLVLVIVYYSLHLKKLKANQLPNGFAFLIFLYFDWINKLSLEILGKKYQKFTPFFIYLFSLLFVSNMFSVLGFEPVGIAFVVPLSLALLTFIITILSGIKFRRWSYVNDYITWISFKKVKLFPFIDPFKILGKITPVISLSFRFWGNVFAGSLITGLVYYVFNNFVFNNQIIHWFGSFITGFIVFPIHFYFDLLDGTIQPLIFMMLTMVYWSIEADLTDEQKYGQEELDQTMMLEKSYTKQVKALMANL